MKSFASPLLRGLSVAALFVAGCAGATAPGDTPTPPESPTAEAAATRALTPTADAAAGTPALPETGGTPGAASAAITVLAGAGRGTQTVNAFFPLGVQVSVGDTVTWTLNSDEIHTVSFLGGEAFPPFAVPTQGGVEGEIMVNPLVAFPTRAPGAPEESFNGTDFVSSGIMAPVQPGSQEPPNDTFSLTFDRPGVYEYVCLIHGASMSGTVTVVEDTAAQARPSGAEAEASVQANAALGTLNLVHEQTQVPRSVEGPAGSTLWLVNAGSSDYLTPDPRSELLEFGPSTLTVRAGDTVVWGSNTFHTVTFVPQGAPPPEFILPQEQPQGPPNLVLNAEVLNPARPRGVYDPTQYYNSGIIGAFGFHGQSWALTFDRPGTFSYLCIVHLAQGMTGTITVEP